MRIWAALAVFACSTTTLLAATPWHHPLYLDNGGYWQQRLRVDLHNGLSTDTAGAPAAVTVGVGVGEADLAGVAAETVRAVNAGEGDPVAAVRAATGGGPEVVIETAGTPDTIAQAMRMVRTGGVVVLVGLPPADEVTLPVMDQLTREYDVRAVARYANCYPPALSLIAAGKINLAALRSHRFPLEQTEQALRQVIQHKGETMKVMVVVG